MVFVLKVFSVAGAIAAALAGLYLGQTGSMEYAKYCFALILFFSLLRLFAFILEKKRR